MKVTHKFLRNNFLIIILGFDVLYVILFLFIYLWQTKVAINLSSILEISYSNIAFVLLLLHPIILIFFMYINSRDNSKYINAINVTIEEQEQKLEEINNFVDHLRQGQFNIDFSQKFNQDKLVRSLQNMRDDIEKTRKEDQLRQIEEQQRHWVNEGLAKFGAILRENVANLESLSSEVTSNITKYMNCQQTGFFVVNTRDGEKYLEMIALFAYDRKKFPDKRFYWGEGLIGAAAIEQKTIFLKETSNDFVNITSGLGKANPRAVLIVPIKDSENVVHGVIELASFKVFEDFEVNFVEQVADSIGLTIATLKTTLRTQELLKESQKQAEMLAQQDETMRQKIAGIEEEREKSENRAIRLNKLSELIEESFLKIIIDRQGNITQINELFLQMIRREEEKDVLGLQFINLVDSEYKEKYYSTFKQIYETGEKHDMTIGLIASTGNRIFIQAILLPIQDIEGTKITSVMILAGNRTKERQKSLDNTQILDIYSTTTYQLSLDTDGYIIYANEKFKELKEINTEQTIFEILSTSESNEFSATWTEIINGKKYTGQFSIKNKEEEDVILDINFYPSYNIDNIISKINLIATDVTGLIKSEQTIKKLEAENTNINEQIKQMKKDDSLEIINLRKEAETKYKVLEQKADMLEQLFNTTKEALVIVKKENIIFFNQVAEDLWSHKKEIVIGKKLRYLFPDDTENQAGITYAGLIISDKIKANIEEQRTYVLNKKMEKKEVLIKANYFEFEKENYIGIFLKPI